MQRDQHVGWFNVAVDNSLLVRMLNRAADPDKKLDAFSSRQTALVGIIGNLYAANQLHHEVGATDVGRSRIQNARDVRVVHEGQSLTFSFEPGHHLASV